MKSIDDAIKHCEEVAYQNEILMKRYDDASGYNRSHNEKIRTDDAKGCEKLISLYRQLAEWLKELKGYKKAYTEIDSKIECDYMGNNEYEMAVSDGYQGTINIIDRCIEEVKNDNT